MASPSLLGKSLFHNLFEEKPALQRDTSYIPRQLRNLGLYKLAGSLELRQNCFCRFGVKQCGSGKTASGRTVEVAAKNYAFTL
jgi:hypothetical protein